ncbi:Sec1-like protein [Pisolithus marmoratus]|nr:Sec1-like protein [Pisolithus marmoratus]
MSGNQESKITSDVTRTNSLTQGNSIISTRIRNLTFLLLLGTPSLERLLEIIEQKDETQWRELKGLLVDRTSNINVIASLTLGTSAAFLTTSGPTDIANWSHPFPYLCLLACSVFATLSVLSGFGLLAFINTLRPSTVKEMQSNNFKFAVTITLLTMPFVCLFASGLASVTGSLAAVWYGNSTWARTGVTIGPSHIFAFIEFVDMYWTYEEDNGHRQRCRIGRGCRQQIERRGTQESYRMSRVDSQRYPTCAGHWKLTPSESRASARVIHVIALTELQFSLGLTMDTLRFLSLLGNTCGYQESHVHTPTDNTNYANYHVARNSIFSLLRPTSSPAEPHLKALKEVFVNFWVTEVKTFSMNAPEFFFRIYSPPRNETSFQTAKSRLAEELQFVNKRIADITLNEFLYIRFYLPSHHPSGPLQPNQQTRAPPPPEGSSRWSTNLARGRAMDVISPFIREFAFTYEVMCNDLLPIENGTKYSYKLSPTSSGYGFDVDDCANKFVGDHPGFTGSRAAGLNDMNDMLASLPQDKEYDEGQILKALVEGMVPPLDSQEVIAKQLQQGGHGCAVSLPDEERRQLYQHGRLSMVKPDAVNASVHLGVRITQDALLAASPACSWHKAVRSSAPVDNRQRIIVFIAGGMIYSEVQEVYTLSALLRKDSFAVEVKLPNGVPLSQPPDPYQEYSNQKYLIPNPTLPAQHHELHLPKDTKMSGKLNFTTWNVFVLQQGAINGYTSFPDGVEARRVVGIYVLLCTSSITRHTIRFAWPTCPRWRRTTSELDDDIADRRATCTTTTVVVNKPATVLSSFVDATGFQFGAARNVLPFLFIAEVITHPPVNLFGHRLSNQVVPLGFGPFTQLPSSTAGQLIVHDWRTTCLLVKRKSRGQQFADRHLSYIPQKAGPGDWSLPTLARWLKRRVEG